jgi:hypothetical protein
MDLSPLGLHFAVDFKTVVLLRFYFLIEINILYTYMQVTCGGGWLNFLNISLNALLKMCFWNSYFVLHFV